MTENDNKSIASEEDWEDVYNMTNDMNKILGDHEHLQKFKRSGNRRVGVWSTVYYQTYGGGPEGGYFSRCFHHNNKIVKREIYMVHRSWGNPFSVELLHGKKLKYREEDEMKGITQAVMLLDA